MTMETRSVFACEVMCGELLKRRHERTFWGGGNVHFTLLKLHLKRRKSEKSSLINLACNDQNANKQKKPTHTKNWSSLWRSKTLDKGLSDD